MKINSQYIPAGEPVRLTIHAKEYTIDFSRFFDTLNTMVGGVNPADDDKALKSAARRSSFLKFWDMYGKKNKKEDAWKKWNKLTEHEIKRIFETLPAFLATKPNNDMQYRPYPSTYLYGKRWEDELNVPVKRALPEFASVNTFGR